MLGSRTVTVGYDSATNRAISSTDTSGGLRSIGYDARGNVTLLGDITFTYDRTDQPVSQGGGVPATFRYDGNLKRVKQVMAPGPGSGAGAETIYSVYDASGALIHRDNVTTGQATDYLSLGGHPIARVENATPTYLFADHQGTPQMGRQANGNWLFQEQYTPFGEKYYRDTDNDNHTSYTGHIEDTASGLTYMQARFYDPVIGRFLSIDPVGFGASGNNPGMFNRYSYGLNDPVNMVDPNGEAAIYFNFQATFQVGGFGGRIGVAVGVDTKKRTAFVAQSGGSQNEVQNTNEGNGIQMGVGAGLGIASSSDYVVAPAYTTDVDAIVASVSVAANDPVMDADGNVTDLSVDLSKDASTTSGADTSIRQVEVGVGIGVGISTVKTEGSKAETALPFVPRPENDPCASGNNCSPN